MPEMSLMLNH